MDHISNSNSTNFTNKLINMSKEGNTRNVVYEVNTIITVIVNGIASPLTVALNVLVIMAVKRRSTLQSYPNILLACLAATDVWTGLTAQTSYIAWKIYELAGMSYDEMEPSGYYSIHNSLIRTLSVCSCLHLVLVTCERLIAIKLTMRYPYLVTKRNIKKAVIAFWVFAVFCGTPGLDAILLVFLAFTFLSCILFILCSYLILYLETLRHQKKMKTQQMPQDEVERMAKESKAFNTTVLVVGAVVLCFAPTFFYIVLRLVVFSHNPVSPILAFRPWPRTFTMLNSFFNPLIYCWRQREIRKFVFGFRNQAVLPAN